MKSKANKKIANIKKKAPTIRTKINEIENRRAIKKVKPNPVLLKYKITDKLLVRQTKKNEMIKL